MERKQCKVCVGCGRCGACVTHLQVITDSFLKSELLSTELSVDKGSFVIADIGTTTIAMELYDTRGKKLGQYVVANPQRIFGADVISRIQAAESPLVAKQLQGLVKKVLQQGLEELQRIEPHIQKVYMAGNTTMVYLLLGYDARELGYAPFQARHLEGTGVKLGERNAYILHGLSAFVGGDVLAGILATGMVKKDSFCLLIDLGTNGEMVLGNRERLLACSTAAGPAFEGMLQANGQAVWGADIVKYVAELLEQGILDETGLLAEAYFEEGVTIGGVCITQEYVRNLQTAKAAIAAGIQILVREYGISLSEISEVYLAGGFGYFLEEKAAMKLGLLPKELQGKVRAVGNTALAGCYRYHFEETGEKEVAKIKAITRVINLAEAEGFSEEFIARLNFE